jgi:hypothetical protein
MRVTCNASYYEDNSDSCELWVPGSPLFPMEMIIEIMGDGQDQARRSQFEAAFGMITATNLHR